MRTSLYALAIAALALGWTSAAEAQIRHYEDRPIEVNVHAGGISVDGGDTELLAGGRLAYNMPSGFGIGGNFDWVQVGDDQGDITLYLYSADVSYTFPSDNQLHFFVSGGVGAATFSFDDELEDLGAESQTELAIPLGGGVKWFNRVDNPTWGIRADVKDHIIVQGDQEVGAVTVEGETTNNFEFSAGVSFFLGGGM
ncbi:MAG: outer membrane beta-barrel protein [Gemmatimonadota bacterium]|nr:outer membrane beta-barrel protein [Gemmatimonadota bacterium]